MEKHPVTTRRLLPQDPQEIWDRLTTPEGFERWMGTGSTIEATPGGRLVAADFDSGEPKTGEVLEVDPGERVRWAWRPLGEPDETSEVEIELRPSPADGPDSPSTEIIVTERPTTVRVPWVSDATQACAVNGLATR